MLDKKSKRVSRKPKKSSNYLKDLFSRAMDKIKSRTPKKKIKKSPKKSQKKSQKKSPKKSPNIFSRLMKKLSMKKSKRPSRKCREHLSDKIRINMLEYKNGRYKSPKQAIAVSYSQVQKMHPTCKRYLKKM